MTKDISMYRLLALIFLGFSLQAQAQVNNTGTPSGGSPFFPSNKVWNAFGIRTQVQDFFVSEGQLQDTCNCGPQSLKSRGNNGIAISYYHNTASRLAYSFDIGFSSGRVSTKSVPTILAEKKSLITLRGDVYYNMGPLNQPVTPYLHTGLHTQFGGFYSSLPLGFGFRYTSGKRPIMFTGELNYGLGLTKDLRNSMIAGLGMYISLNKSKKTASPETQAVVPPPPPPPADTDKDGVADNEDKCPSVYGLSRYGGCPIPDTDGDGINDEEDKCPKVSGLPRYGGCPIPDTDGDGINDEEDKCPKVSGLPRYGGCPIPDTDGDGLNDEVDACPSDKGSSANKGCPLLEELTEYGFDFRKVQFITGSAALTKIAKAELDKAVRIMTDHPAIKVSIEGHTDNVGRPAMNQLLSEKRAASVKAYVVSKGIAADRMRTSGFGPTKPIATNNTVAGKALNRRVEFKSAN